MACNCEALEGKVDQLLSILAGIKPVNEEEIIQRAIKGSTSAILPKIPSDTKIKEMAALAVVPLVAPLAYEEIKRFTDKHNYATKPEVNELRTNLATKAEVKAAKAEAEKTRLLSESLRKRQAEIAEDLAKKAAMNDLGTLEGQLRKQISDATDIATDAKKTATTALTETKTLGGKVQGILAQVGAEIEKVVAPLRSGLGKLQGAVDGILTRITSILDQLGVLSPLKKLIGLVGKLLWVIDIISAFMSADTFATVKGLVERVQGMENRQDVLDSDISRLISKQGVLQQRIDRALGEAQKATDIANKAANDAADASDRASNALGKALRAIDESGSASSAARSAIADAKRAIGDASDAASKARDAASLATTAKNEIVAVKGGLADAFSRIDATNGQLNSLRGGLEQVRGEAFGASALAREALSIGIGLTASYALAKGSIALLGSRVGRVENELSTVKSRPGIPGRNGRNGLDGRIGRDGINGKDGLRGIPGLRGLPGIPGLRGLPGISGRNGVDGKSGLNGKPGLDGRPGTNGRNGINGQPGAPGRNGINGKDGKDVNSLDLAAINAKLDRNFGEIKSTNIQATGANQKATILQRSVSGLNAFVVTNFATTIQLVKNFSGAFERFAKWSQLGLVLQVLTWTATLHNAMMLSSQLGQTLFGVVGNILQAAGLKGSDGSPINVNAIISQWTDSYFKAVFGVENVNTFKAEWKKYNTIFQAASNMILSIQSLGYAIIAAVEVLGSNIAQVGNALKFFRVVGEKAYGWMNPTPNFNNSFVTNIEKMTAFASAIDTASQSVIGVQQAFDGVNAQKKALDNSLKQAEASKQATKPPEAASVKQAQDLIKLNSKSVEIPEEAKANPED